MSKVDTPNSATCPRRSYCGSSRAKAAVYASAENCNDSNNIRIRQLYAVDCCGHPVMSVDLRQTKSKHDIPSHDRDILFAVDPIRHRARSDAGLHSGLEQLAARPGVKGVKVAV